MNSDQFETGIPAPQGLYDFEQERDACGVGLVADLKNEPSHKIIETGITVLKRLMHRGAVGSDPDTGDGAGILLALPDEFFRLALPNKLPARGKYGVAMMFGGCGHEEELEAAVTENGGSAISFSIMRRKTAGIVSVSPSTPRWGREMSSQARRLFACRPSASRLSHRRANCRSSSYHRSDAS